jgi:putative ABC transport system permease protein
VFLRLFPYHLRLAAKSLQRDPWLSAAIVVVMAIAASIWCTALQHYLRLYGPLPARPPGLSQVELPHSEFLDRVFLGTNAAGAVLTCRARVSYPDYQRLASSGIPTRATASFRSRLLIASADDRGPALPPQYARFVNADFFSMFELPIGRGAPWTRAQEAQGEPVVVLGQALARQLFPAADPVGSTVRVDGRPFRVVGVIDGEQPFLAEWDRPASGGWQDALYLPFPEHQRLRAAPELAIFVSPAGRTRADLFASDAIFVSYWMDLPDAAHRQAYTRFLDQNFGARGVRYQLRDLHQLRIDFAMPTSAISFFAFLTLVLVCGAGLIMTRLLLAKGLARREELGIFRALGVPRRALLVRQLIEAALLSLLAATLSLLLALWYAAYYNRAVSDTDIPIGPTALVIAITFGTTLLVGLLSALYPAWRSAGARPTVALGGRW